MSEVLRVASQTFYSLVQPMVGFWKSVPTPTLWLKPSKCFRIMFQSEIYWCLKIKLLYCLITKSMLFLYTDVKKFQIVEIVWLYRILIVPGICLNEPVLLIISWNGLDSFKIWSMGTMRAALCLNQVQSIIFLRKQCTVCQKSYFCSKTRNSWNAVKMVNFYFCIKIDYFSQ